MSLPALYPGVVKAYDAVTRLCTVEIPGFTDGCEQFPVAEIMQALGDRTEHTEIRILAGDRVWLQFQNGDPRYPIIVGFRAKNRGNMVGTRHWEHENFDTQADQNIVIQAGQVITIEAGQQILLKVGGTTIDLTASLMQLTSAIIKLNE